MKAVIFIGTLLLIFISTSIFVQITVQKQSQELQVLLERIIGREDCAQAAQDAEEIVEIWKKTQNKWEFLFDHAEIDVVSQQIWAMEVFAKNNDIVHTRVEARLAAGTIKRMIEQMVLQFNNVV